MSDENSETRDDRDEELLRQIRYARQRADGCLLADLRQSDLLARHAGFIKRLAKFSRGGSRLSDADLDEIVNDVFKRLVKALRNNNYEFEKPFRYVVADNIPWAVIDHLRTLGHLNNEVYPGELPEPKPDGDLPLSEVEDARSYSARIQSLSEREQRIVTARIIEGLSSKELAAELDTTHGAIDTAFHRAVGKLADQHADEE